MLYVLDENMNIEEKLNLAFDIIKRAEVSEDKDAVWSIADCIKNERFFIEYNEGKIVIFLTWEDNQIDGKRYIFVNNLWIEPSYRSPKTLVRVRTVLKYLLINVYKFYWHNRQKDKMIYRS